MSKITTRWALVALAAVGLSGLASAQTFTFESTTTDQTMLGMAPGAGPSGQHWTADVVTTFADGSTATSSTECVATSQPPNNSIFAMHGICEGSADSGTWASIMGCNPMGGGSMSMGCVGGLYGKTGDFEGMQGAFTAHVSGGTSHGTGEWYEAEAADEE